MREGEDGNSFYVVASGASPCPSGTRRGGAVVLARLGEGDFFGEMALLSGAPRSATVTAEDASEVLEFRADVLLDIAGHHPHVAQSLRRFYRQRLLANALAMSPIFRPFQRGERKLIMERFLARAVTKGDDGHPRGRAVRRALRRPRGGGGRREAAGRGRRSSWVTSARATSSAR